MDTNTQRLSPDEQQTWMALAGMLTRLPAALDAQLTKDAGMTFFEYMVLAVLNEAPERKLRMSVLAERTNGSLSRLSHVVRRLEAAGLVRREGAPEDRRATNAILTDEGRDRVEAAAPGHVEFARTLVLDVVDDEDMEAVGRVGERILDQLAGERPGHGQASKRRRADAAAR